MVIDTSALIAILFAEPERARFVDAIDADFVRLISVVTFVEASFVIVGRKHQAGLADLENFLAKARIERVPVDHTQADLAVLAFQRFGKGQHRAKLNIGDCFAYALAKSTGQKLLFKGNDFIHTDLEPAIPAP